MAKTMPLTNNFVETYYPLNSSHVFNHPALHPLFETLAYVVSGLVYRAQRSRQGDVIDEEHRWVVIAAAAVGALIGSRVLGLATEAPHIGFHWNYVLQSGGKTIVGGLLGGWVAVEIAKRIVGIRSRTGDLFAIPLCIGIAVGRVGCLLAGFADDTYGKPTSLPWGIDLGDGVPRHPVQLYEIIFLLVLAFILHRLAQRPHANGALFRIFLASYLLWRLFIDFLKPQPLVYGMNLIQWSCLTGVFLLAVLQLRDTLWHTQMDTL